MRHPIVRPVAAFALGLALLASVPSAARQKATPTNVTSISAADFFTTTKVWTAHLSMTADAWKAMQPRGGNGGGGFGFGGGGRFLGPEGGRNGVAARQGIEFDYVHATLQINDWTFPDVAVRYKGNGSYLRATRGGGDKISLKVDLNKHVKGQKLAGVTTLNFQNNITDVGWMNEVLAYRLYRDAGALAPRTAYAQVYLNVEGQEKYYLGLYSISENIDENFFEERFGTKKGAIFKPSTTELFTNWGDDWSVYNQAYDPKTDLTDAQKKRVIELGRLVSSASDAEYAAKIADFVDLDDFADYFAVLVWLANHDSLLQNGQNFYTYLHPDTNRMHFIAWDQDFSFGNGRFSSNSWSIYTPWSGNNLFLSRIYKLDSFREKYLARMAQLSEQVFLTERFRQQVAEIGPAIRPSIELEGKEWLSAFDQVVAGKSGIVPFAEAREAYVKADLQKKDSAR
jgi:spore coat protein H